MALPATDSFNRADGGLGANWGNGVGVDLRITGNRVEGSTSDQNASQIWVADAPSPNQYAKVTLAAHPGSGYTGPLVRASATDFVLFDAAISEGHYKIEWYNNDAWTTIGNVYGVAPAAGDVLEIQAEGQTFRGYVNGVLRCEGTNQNAPSGGSGGIYAWSSGIYTDNFEVGNLGGGGPVELVVQGAAHGHGAGAPALTQGHNLSVAGAAHGHSAASPALTQAHQLAVSGAVHGHSAAEVALSQDYRLAVDGAAHDHTAESPSLTQAHSLAVDGAAHQHAAESPALTQAHTLAVAGAEHAHGGESPTLTFGVLLDVQAAVHGHGAANVALTQEHVLAVAGAIHQHVAEVASLVQQHILAVQGAEHGHEARVVTLVLPATYGIVVLRGEYITTADLSGEYVLTATLRGEYETVVTLEGEVA